MPPEPNNQPDQPRLAFRIMRSAWWIPALLLIGLGPGFVTDFLEEHGFKRRTGEEGVVMGWLFIVGPLTTLLAALDAVAQLYRLFSFLNKPKPSSMQRAEDEMPIRPPGDEGKL